MSLYDYDQPPPAPPAPPRRSSSRIAYNVATVIALLATLCLCLVFLGMFLNPYGAWNPYPPPTQVGALVLPTITWTPLPLPATWTPQATLVPSSTATLAPSVTPGVIDTPVFTLLPAASETSGTVTATARPSATPRPTGAPFTAEAVAVDGGAIFGPSHDCTWWGVGGTAADLNGNPIVGLQVKLAGILPSSQVDLFTVTGTAPIYGQGGFEFRLGDTPLSTNDRLYAQLLDQAGLPLSEQIYFDTSSECTQNLILVRFRQVR